VNEIEMPRSFHQDEEWGPWVLEHGVPSLPAAVGVDEAVPVARWISGRWAAIVYLRYCEPDPDPDPDPEPDPEFDPDEASLETDAQSYRRVDGAWEMTESSGGTSWWGGLELVRPAFVGAREAFGMGLASSWEGGRSYSVVEGIAGSDATSVEIEQGGRVERCELDSSMGVWVAAFDGHLAATVRVRAGDLTIFEEIVSPETW
jgi:hypothetical protein